jgi:hypothetical protein
MRNMNGSSRGRGVGGRQLRARAQRFAAVVASLAAVAALPASASTVVWAGGSGVWSTAGNWVGGAAPTSSDVATFSGWAPLSRSGWVPSASSTAGGDALGNAIDGLTTGRWSTGAAQAIGEWFKVDMGAARTFSGITLDAGTNITDYPGGFDVYVSNDDVNYGSSVGSAVGTTAFISLAFAAQTARYVKIMINTASNSAHWWSISELNVFGSAGNTQLARSSWSATASATDGTNVAANALDNATATYWRTGAAQIAPQWFKIDMGSAQTFTQINIDAATDTNDYPHGYAIYAYNTDDGLHDGSPIATGVGTAALVTVTVSSQTARYIKIVQTSAFTAQWWSLHELNVLNGATTLSRAAWVASASLSTATAINAIDGMSATRWTTGTGQVAPQWFKIDMGSAQTFTQIRLDDGTRNGEYPQAFAVYAYNTDDGLHDGNPIYVGTSAVDVTDISFSAQSARYIKVLITGAAGSDWSITEATVYGVPVGSSIAASITVAGLVLSNAVTVTQASGATVTVNGGYTQTAGAFVGGNSAVSVSGAFSLTNGSFTTNAASLTCSGTSSAASIGSGGAFTVGAATQTFAGGLSVLGGGTLTLATSGGKVAIGSGMTFAMDGTLAASSTGASIQSAAGSYTFKVGSTATATPTLNVTGLQVKNTDTNGMWIDANTSAVTTFTAFDNIAFSGGTGNYLLQIYSKALYLSSHGCTFDASGAATTTYTVKLQGNGTGDGADTRMVLGNTTCSSSFTSCQASKRDDDSDNDGVGNTPASDGAVVQFVRTVADDTSGTIEGFPVAAFDWNTFSYYATYAEFHDVTGTADRLYVRDGNGTAEYAWDGPSGEDFIGAPRPDTVGTTHYVYVATTAGHIYRLIDSGTALAPDNTGSWSGTANPYSCGCTITTPLVADTTNLYWTGVAAANQSIYTLSKSSRSQPMGSPVIITPTLTSAIPAAWVSGGNTYLFVGAVGNLVEVDITNQAVLATNTSPGAATVYGRINIGGTSVFAGDDGGTMWSVSATNFSGTNKLWSYHDPAGAAIRSSSYYDSATNTVMYGTEAGTVFALDSSGAALTGYPYSMGASSDSVRSAVLYLSGVLVVGTTTGKLQFIDRRNGTTGPALIRAYNFGPSESVSGVAYDGNTSRFMVSTSSSSAKDGRLYYFDAVTDPTPGSL